MAWLQIKISVSAEYAEKLGDLLSATGAAAVTLQDAAEQPVYEPAVGTTPIWRQTQIIGLFPSNVNSEHIIAEFKQLVTQELPLFDIQNLELLFQVEPLADQAWERIWMDNYNPMRFGKQLWICPSWCAIPDPTAVNIMLDPGLAFGTGTHPTTALCLEWLADNPPVGQTVVDYGCGSGILAIAAAKLGAAKIFAIDNDPQALEATYNNAQRNNITNKSLQTLLPSELPTTLAVDVIIANILAKPLIELVTKFAQIMSSGSKIALSGILLQQADEVIENYSPWFDIYSQSQTDGWVRLSGTRK